MSLQEKVLTGKQLRPLRVIIYGPGGIGKSFWASQWKESLILDIEGGLGGIDCASIPLIGKPWSEILSTLTELATEEHDYKTIVLDSLDWLERLMHIDICQVRGCISIGDLQYGAGYVQALSTLKSLFSTWKHSAPRA